MKYKYNACHQDQKLDMQTVFSVPNVLAPTYKQTAENAFEVLASEVKTKLCVYL